MRTIGSCCVLILGMGGCGGGTEPTNGVASVSLTPTTVDTLFSLGDTVRLIATPRDAAGGTVPGVSVTFETSAPIVASVSESGLVTSEGNGVATISASASNVVSAPVVVRVRQKLASFEMPTAASVAVDRTTALSAVPADARGIPITGLARTFVSRNESVATVDASGVVTGVALGSVTIAANVVSAADGARSDSSVVTVTAGPPPTATVTMSANAFLPDTVHIAVSGTVTWVNGSGEFHDVDFGGGPPLRIAAFDSGERSLTFPNAGTLAYHCNIHAGMEATVVVQ